jgi:hypothetical protein
MYRQVGAALLLPQHLMAVLSQWPAISKALAATPRKRKRFEWHS